MKEDSRNLYVRKIVGIEGIEDRFSTEGVLVGVPASLDLNSERGVISHSYFGVNRRSAKSNGTIGMHLVIDINGAELSASYHDIGLISRFIDEIGLGTRAHEHGVADISGLAGIEVDTHYVPHEWYGRITVALSMISGKTYKCGFDKL